MLHKPDIKCAPSKEYKDGSCFTEPILKKIALNYNKQNQNKIDLNGGKKELVKELSIKLADKCSDQVCWLRLDIVKELENDDLEEIEENTFRPKGPTKKYEWLSTNHINEVIQQYHDIYKDFLFLGAVPLDFEELPILGLHNINYKDFEDKKKFKIGLVINLDEHNQNGSHWVSLFFNLKKNQIYFFDSIGRKPAKKIRHFINSITKYLYYKKYKKELPINDIIQKLKDLESISESKKQDIIKSDKYLNNLFNGGFDIRFNTIQHQFKNSECGVYSINFIIRLASGESFDSVINDITKDDIMNKNRSLYFRNVN